jgi:hypothetical protein
MLLSNDFANNCVFMAVIGNINRGTILSLQSMPRCYFHVIEWLWTRFGLVIRFVTCYYPSQIIIQHTMSSQPALSSAVIAWQWIPTVSSAFMLMFLAAGDCLTTNSLLQLSTLSSVNWLTLLSVLHITSQHGPQRKHRSVVAVSSCCTRSCYLVMSDVYLLISQSSNGPTCYTASSLRLFVLNSLQAYCHLFFSEGCTVDVFDRSRLPSLWIISHGDYSSTALAASS